ncbi:TIGR01458 family HAD-type hydrolase [Agromyces aurantiacus]|uniref:Haloacid dehalogenase-like hydrolase domain-containing protein 2 n=1 Tax=Agromyces aurantiacus TaxID=165814 RepID=A0ABV9R708_9MICO|nr:TIGR01458 family HAD-type hydrolase [Agromyces aurantiacus]MBM7505178.1 HAD superfamily hydrolase (TIGR01458 family) [Agromyces aurantiacus]
MAGLLLDLDGVVYVGDAAVPGAREALDRLVREGVPHRFVTNTSSRPRRAIVEKLARLGVTVREEDILTPAVAAAAWMQRRGLSRPALFVPDATAGEFAGFDALTRSADDGADAVVVGDLGDGWDFATLNHAFRLLMADPAVPLVALGLTRYWRAEDGLRLDAGAFVRALEYAAGREAIVLGKPDAAFYHAATDALGLDPADVVMVGDDLRADVEGAQRAGLAGVLVRTGKFAPSDLEAEVVPDAVLDSLADLPDWWAARGRS